jgi:hypothetical protein
MSAIALGKLTANSLKLSICYQHLSPTCRGHREEKLRIVKPSFWGCPQSNGEITDNGFSIV